MSEVRVQVPATSANIGSGFDTMGIAFDLYNRFRVREISSGLTFVGAEEYAGEENLVYKAMMRVFKEVGYKPSGLYIEEDLEIPTGVGLGSSATFIVGGLTAANALLDNPLSKTRLMEIATEMEGHPDNVVPALIGGLTATVVKDGKVYPVKREVEKDYRFYALIPNFILPTKEARTLVPERFSRREVVDSISRALLTFTALTSKDMSGVLSEIFGDVLHEPYRKGLIPGYEELSRSALENGALLTYLSGAGPTMMTILDSSAVDEWEYRKMMQRLIESDYPDWDFRALPLSSFGTEYRLE